MFYQGTSLLINIDGALIFDQCILNVNRSLLETIILTLVGFSCLNLQDELKGDYETILVALCGSDN